MGRARVRARTGRGKATQPARLPTWYWQSWRIKGQARTGCGAWPGPGRRRAGSSAGWREPAGRRTATPGTSGLPAVTRASSPAQGLLQCQGGGRYSELCHPWPGLRGKICAEKGAISGHPNPPHSPGGRAEGAVGLGTWGPGQQALESTCGPVHTHAWASVSARERRVCSCSARPLPRGPGRGPGWGGLGGAGRGPYLVESRPARSSLRAQHPAPVSRPGSHPASSGCPAAFGSCAPHCLQRGRSGCRSPHPFHWGPANRGQARLGPTAHRGVALTGPPGGVSARYPSLARAPEAHEVQSPRSVAGDAGQRPCARCPAGRAGRL